MKITHASEISVCATDQKKKKIPKITIKKMTCQIESPSEKPWERKSTRINQIG